MNETVATKEEEQAKSFILKSFLNALGEAFRKSDLNPKDYVMEDKILERVEEVVNTGISAFVMMGDEQDLVVIAFREEKAINFVFQSATIENSISVSSLLNVMNNVREAA